MKKYLHIAIIAMIILSCIGCQKDDEIKPLLKNDLKERGLIDDKHKPAPPKLYEDFVAREFYESPANVPTY